MRRAGPAVAASALLVALAVSGDDLAVAGIRAYRLTIAPLTAAAGFECRFTTSCSRFGEIAIARDGLLRGGWRTMRRVARCHPWTPMGTIDEP